MQRRDWFTGIALAALAVFLSACAAVLPKSSETTLTAWNTYADAKAAFDKIQPNDTDMDALRALGYDPEFAQNVRILSYLELQERFMPNQSIGWQDLDPNVRDCLRAHDKCKGLMVNPEELHRDRVGNAVLDIFNFRREVLKSGWEFEALILIKDDTVAYKTWSGKPRIYTHERKINPLGPLQDLGGFAADKAQARL